MSASTEFADVALPDYDIDQNHPLPLYSQTLRSSECLLQYESPRRTGCPACEWIFQTKHFTVNLGRRQWKIKAPAYGLNGVVEGSITFPSSSSDRAESVTATIEGRLSSTVDRKGDINPPFLSRTYSIYGSNQSEELDEIPFSIPFPSQYFRNGKEFPLPPSFYFSEPNFNCEVFYSIKFGITWKSKRKQRYQEKSIGIYYLPKTNPADPPICVLPPASRHCENPPLFLQGADRMESFPIIPSFLDKKLKRNSIQNLDKFKESVYLSLPKHLSFTSGQEIPFMISLAFPQEPFLADMLCSNPQVHLFKRISLIRPGSSERVEKDVLISTGSLRKSGGWAEGVVVLRGEIRAGHSGGESSWRLESMASVKYFLRISLRPPDQFSCPIPIFTHEAVVDITTHAWGSLEREMVSSGGITSPAIGLAHTLRRIY